MWRDFTEQLSEIEKPLVDFYVKILREKLQGEYAPEVLEVGSGYGLFSRSAMESILTLKITTIDSRDPLNPSFLKHTAGYEDRIRSIAGKKSADAIPRLRKEGFHFIFIDADHGYEGSLSDARLAWEKLKSGGWMLFDDVFHKNNWKINSKEGDEISFDYGTTRSAFEFAKEKGITKMEAYTFGHGLILIQKP